MTLRQRRRRRSLSRMRAQSLMVLVGWATLASASASALTVSSPPGSSSSPSSTSSLQLDYSTISSTGRSCPGRDSCRQNTGRSTRGPDTVEMDWKKRNCFCDNSCALYGDCCIDAPAFAQREQMVNFKRFHCVNLKQYGDVYIRHECAEDWAYPNIKAACERPPGASASDPFGSTHVTNMGSGITYRNYYCAVCNDDSAADLRFWQPRLECPTLTGYNSRFKNLTAEFIKDRLRYDNGRGRWGVELDTGGIPVFHECSVDPSVPADVMPKIRSCSGHSTISTCPQSFADHRVRELCHSYTAMVFQGRASFRNVHCAICNGAALDMVVCLSVAYLSRGRNNWQQNFNTFSFAVLLDINGGSDVGVGKRERQPRCLEGELFDPFFRRCRNVVCPGGGDLFVDGRCVDPAASTLPSATTSTTTTSTTTTTITTTTTTTTTTTASSTSTEETPLDDDATTIDFVTHPEVVEVVEPTTEETTVKRETTQSVPLPSPVAITTTPTVLRQPNTTRAPNFWESTHPKESHSSKNNATDRDVDLVGGHGHKNDTVLATCPKFHLEEGDYALSADGDSANIPAYNVTLNATEFEVIGGRLVICIAGVARVAKEEALGESKFSDAMGYVTFGGLGLSVVCLLLHIVATILAPELQNLSGKNLFSLCLALLGGYTCFMANMFRSGEEGDSSSDTSDSPSVAPPSFGCVVLAVTMYYFFLSSFFWMMSIAVDVCRTLRQASTQLRLTAGAQWKKFCLYSLVSWVVPLALAVVAVAIDANPSSVPESMRPHFGESELCWFGKKRALLVFFAGPFAVIMFINVILFLSSACVVYDTTKGTSSKLQASCGPRTNFHLYLRLAVIMGLTWIVGLVAALVDMEEVWFAFVVLNTTQGLFIFASFTCNRKVGASLKARLCGGKHTYRPGMAVTSRRTRTYPTNSTTPSRTTRISSSSSSAAAGSGWRNVSSTSPPNRSDLSGAAPQNVSMHTPRHRRPDPSPRGSTMYTVSKYQASGEISHNSFDGRYY